MKIFKYISFLLLIAVIGTIIYIAVQPNQFSFSSSRLIKVPSSILYNKVNDFKNWHEFSPWIENEPKAKLSYGEKTVGAGGNYSWNGEILGESSMKTLAVKENKSISQYISFTKPYKTDSETNWTFETTEAGTKVTWSMKGHLNFMTKMLTIFKGTSIEKNTIPDFERGLFKLDSVATADMKKYTITANGITQHNGGYYLYHSTSCKINALKSKIATMFPEVMAYAKKNNITIVGKPFVNYSTWDEENDMVIFSCGVPINDGVVIIAESDFLIGQLPVFRTVKTTLKGDYSNLKEAWDSTMKYITDNNLEAEENGPMLETYITDATNLDNPADWITELYMAVKEDKEPSDILK
jgi:effector-binding domain-containing protein/ribosome-associated toxin RatA of RatAB toxin-antitoxin module